MKTNNFEELINWTYPRSKQVLEHQKWRPLDEEGNIVPTDPHEFYKLIGPLYHPLTKKPVEQLADYQYKAWNIILHSDLLTIKSNKIGYSTAPALMALIQNCLLKKGAGYEKIVLAQSSQMARSHLYTIRKLMLESKLADFLIIKPREYLLDDEVTKITELFIDNPYNPIKPTRVLGIGASAGAVVSHKNVDYVLASDITMAKDDYTAVLDGVQTRLANTMGRLHIETIPNGPVGRVYELYEGILNGKIDSIQLLEIDAQEAVREGVITQEYLDEMKQKLGVMYEQYFGARFVHGINAVFREVDVEYAFQLGEQYKDLPINQYAMHFGGLDTGYNKAKSVGYIYEVMKEQDFQGLRIIWGEEFVNKHPSYVAKRIRQKHLEFLKLRWFMDGGDRGSVNEVKSEFGERLNWASYKDINPLHNAILPVAFNPEREDMLQHLAELIGKRKIAIPLKYKNLKKAMHTAQAEGWDYDKDNSKETDHLDAAQLGAKGYARPKSDKPVAKR